MKELKVESLPGFDALLDQMADAEGEPIILTRDGMRVAFVVSAIEYEALRRLEEAALEKLDADESAEILKNPQSIGWDVLQRQLKT